MKLDIPFNRVSFVGNELQYIHEAYRQGKLSGDGTFTQRGSRFLESLLGCPRVLLTTSGTHALEMSALLLDIKPGDEVILPSYTFPSVANAFVLRGARPIFADILPDTLNINHEYLPGLITPKTKAIVAVHYAGVGCEMESLQKISEEHKVPILEDNAHALFGKYKGRFLGTFGQMAALSFHETKNISCGEGGALLINNPALIERALILREKGTNRDRFFRGEVDKYSWVDIGSSYLPSDILAAILCAQLEEWQKIQARRREIWHCYDERLKSWADENGVRLPYAPGHCEQSFHMFYLLMPSLKHRDALIAHLRKAGILCVFHYVPLHLSEMGRQLGGKPGDCPVSESVSDRIVRLPFYYGLTIPEQEKVIAKVLNFFPVFAQPT